MIRENTDLLIVGGGPAGMSAAIAAASCGVRSVLVDEGSELGGQVYRKPLVPDAPKAHPTGEALRLAIADHSRRGRIDVRSNTAVWSVFKNNEVAIVAGNRSALVSAKKIILAPGAHEYVPPFPGWTTPGVMTAGAAQIMLKTMGLRPGKRIAIAGSGPLLVALAAQLVRKGFPVANVIEASPFRAWLKLPIQGWRAPRLMAEGLGYLATLRKAGVPVQYGRIVTQAHEENGMLARISHAPVDDDWVPDTTSIESEEIDTLCMSYGLIPRSFIFQIFGCEMNYREDIGGWVPTRNTDMTTSLPNVYAAGDGTGVAGSVVAQLEGELAGLSAAKALGARDTDARIGKVHRALERMRPVREALDAISIPRPGLQTLIRDDTIVCRCEELTWSEVRAGVENGGTKFRTLKPATRLGMGPCQARFCWPSMSRQIAKIAALDSDQIGPISPRPPIRPVTLGAVAAEQGETS